MLFVNCNTDIDEGFSFAVGLHLYKINKTKKKINAIHLYLDQLVEFQLISQQKIIV